MKLKTVSTTIITVIIVVISSWLLSPLWKDTRVDEVFPTPTTSVRVGDEGAIKPSQSEASPTIVAVGVFSGFDSLHNGSGTVKLITDNTKTYIRFEPDFKVTNGPDLYVGLGKNGKYMASAEIAPLKGNLGSQNYLLPDTVNISEYNEVWVWCKAFSVPFARAILK